MAGVIPSFLSSAKLVIKIDGRVMAYATNLSISDRMAVAPVGGIGAYNADALEPLQYSVSGSFAITIYDEGTLTALKAIDAVNSLSPARAASHEPNKLGNFSGNSMFQKNFFSPIHLMISRSIDIEVYEKLTPGAISPDTVSLVQETALTYKIYDARLTSYSLTFTPGSLMQEQIGFIAMRMEDKLAYAQTVATSETT